MRFLLGTGAHNQHVQNVAQALHEAGMLGEYHTGGVDVWRPGWARSLRGWACRLQPGIEAKLSRRKITTIPEALVTADWRWEGSRVLVNRLHLGPLIEDWLWEKGEHALDRYCEESISRPEFDAFLGVEFGALRGLTTAKQLGKPAVVAFLSPHHATRERWVDAEYERFPELLMPATKRLLKLGKIRDARRDREAELADIVHCASAFTRDSLVQAGVPVEKTMVVPLGCANPPQQASKKVRSPTMRFLYSGSVSVHKGAHILLNAWRETGARTGAELHFFGRVNLPQRCLTNLPGVFFHGQVSAKQIAHEYSEASVLVFPTLCDGFGMVVAEAFSYGLPVITTPNAGAADLIRENENGWLVAPGDSEALAERIQWCMDHPELLEEMREPARETARRWAWADFRRVFVSKIQAQLVRIGGLENSAVANCDYSRS